MLMCERCHSQSPSPLQRLPSDSKDNAAPSRLAKCVENNRQTSAGTSREALHRYISSSDRPTMIPNHDSVGASVAAHRAQAQAAIDAADAAMEEQKG
jgi:hypothetical protein